MKILKITKETRIPLLGHIAFGFIDRGTNLIQVRPISFCNLNCIFCSVDAGPNSKRRKTNYIVDIEYMLDYFKEIAKFKGKGVEAHIDSTGEVTMHPKIVDLVKGIKEIKEVKTISMQTNGTLLTKKKIKELEDAGLDRINLSIHSLEKEKSKILTGSRFYNINYVKKVAKWIAESRIDLLIAPVYVPGYNEKDLEEIIKFALEIGAGKKWPPLGIQKYEYYKFGRNPKVKIQSWWQFWNKTIKPLEKKFNMRLKLLRKDFGIVSRPSLPKKFKKGDKVKVKMIGFGWHENESLGIAKDRVISVIKTNVEKGNLKVRIISNKHGIFVSEPIF